MCPASKSKPSCWPRRRSPTRALAVPDDVLGEKVGAVLVGGETPIDVAAVLEHCRGQLADYKIPQYVSVVSEALPRNAGGKLLKAKLRGEVHWGDPLR